MIVTVPSWLISLKPGYPPLSVMLEKIHIFAHPSIYNSSSSSSEINNAIASGSALGADPDVVVFGVRKRYIQHRAAVKSSHVTSTSRRDGRVINGSLTTTHYHIRI